MTGQSWKRSGAAWVSPWLIIGSVCILAVILALLAAKNVRREQQFMVRALLNQAETLMHALEASSRSGMMGMGMGPGTGPEMNPGMGMGMGGGPGAGMGHMGMRAGGGRGDEGWGRRQLQLLMEQTARQPEVVYARLLEADGRVIADSDPANLEQRLAFAPPPAPTTVFRFVTGAESAFEVTRAYRPWSVGRGAPHGSRAVAPKPPVPDQYLVVGLDPTPFDEARRQDRNQTVLLFGLMFLVGAAGFVSLFWAGHYRAARRSLEDIEAYTATIFRQLPVGLVAVAADGSIQETNAAARTILDRPAGFPHSVEQLPAFPEVFREIDRTRTPLEREVPCRLDADRVVPLWLSASPLRDAAGTVTGFVFLFTDMTPIKQLEEQVRRSERMAALGRMAAGIAHEIRNPLSSIKGFAAILGAKAEADPGARRIARVMQQEVERLNRAVTELLEFARPMDLELGPRAVKDLFEHARRLVQDDAERRRVEIRCTVEPADLVIRVDPDRFAQILLNLELNALQAMDGGGRIELSAVLTGDQVLITVADSGPGIAPADLPHVFDPYFTTKADGVGLGLAIVNKLVEAHGGSIEAAGAPGRGARFTLRLPARLEP